MTIFITLHSSQPYKHEITSTMIQQATKPFSTHQHKQLITLPVVIPYFSSLELINVDKSTHHQVPLLPHIYHKEIHAFHTLNKSLEIHLPQIVEQSIQA